MDAVLRALAIYLFLLVLIRLTGVGASRKATTRIDLELVEMRTFLASCTPATGACSAGSGQDAVSASPRSAPCSSSSRCTTSAGRSRGATPACAASAAATPAAWPVASAIGVTR
jgi:hypothetical protein